MNSFHLILMKEWTADLPYKSCGETGAHNKTQIILWSLTKLSISGIGKECTDELIKVVSSLCLSSHYT